MLIGITSECVPGVWKACSPLLEKALKISPGDYTVEDLYNAVMATDMQLWVLYNGEKITTCAVGQILIHPRHKVYNLLYLAGGGLKNILKAYSGIEGFAKQHGCKYLEAGGRKGWLRLLKPTKKWVMFRKEL